MVLVPLRKKSELSVKVPAGIDEGQRLKLRGEGDAGRQGGPAGDLYVVIRIKEHEFFTVKILMCVALCLLVSVKLHLEQQSQFQL